MIRSILLLALLTISFSAFAQKAHSVFLDNRVLDHFQTQMELMVNINQDVQAKNGEDNRSELNKLKKAAAKVSERGLSIYHQMNSYLDKETIDKLEAKFLHDGVGTNALVHRNKQIRDANPQLVEIFMSYEDLNLFLDNVANIQKISDEIQFLKERPNSANTNLVADISSSAKTLTSIITQTSN